MRVRFEYRLILVSFKLAAKKILRASSKPLHYEEITRLALEKNLIETSGATPENTMNAQIMRDIKFNKENSAFKKVKPGYFVINPDSSEKEQKLEEQEEKQDEQNSLETSSTQYIGTAGEHRVVSELLFFGYNASIMSVDEGLDIVATKDNRLFNIQVKTSNENKFNNYVADIRIISFVKFGSGNTFYIFVLRGKDTNFLILPYAEIEKNIQQKNILIVNKGKRYRINISIRDEKLYLGKMKNDVSYFKNNWNLIK